jgi:hypothetical protein
MRSRNVCAFVLVSLATYGCGAAQLAMKAPISNQCASVGLKGCPELTDAVIEYVGGDKTAAETKLRAAAAANTADKLRVFATALKPIGANLGGEAGASLEAIADLLLAESGSAPPSAKASGPGSASTPSRTGASAQPGGASAPPPPNLVVEELRTASERLATNAHLAPCGGVLTSDPKCSRARVFVGPLVVTNAYTSGGCPDELFLLAGRIEKPHWMLLNQAGAAMNVTGQFIVEDGEELFVGARAVGAAPKDDVKCTITWSGFRPLSAPSKKYERLDSEP